MRLMTHLSFDGRCEEAFTLYAACLGGEITLMLRYRESALANTASDLGDRIVHATLQVGDQRLTGADVPADRYEQPRGFAVQLNVDTADDARRIFDTLAEGGVVQMPLQETFWAEWYGVVTDRF